MNQKHSFPSITIGSTCPLPVFAVSCCSPGVYRQPWGPGQSFSWLRNAGPVIYKLYGSIDLVIQVYTNKWMVVRVYLDKGRVSDHSPSLPYSAKEVWYTPLFLTPQNLQKPWIMKPHGDYPWNVNKLKSTRYSISERYPDSVSCFQQLAGWTPLRKFLLVESPCFTLSIFS